METRATNSPNSERNSYHLGMTKNAPAPTSSTTQPQASGQAFSGIKRRPIKVLKPGFDPVKSVRRIREGK
jgi:hypothetical protein